MSFNFLFFIIFSQFVYFRLFNFKLVRYEKGQKEFSQLLSTILMLLLNPFKFFFKLGCIFLKTLLWQMT